MEKLASIFCHIPSGMMKDEAHRELWRQHDRLAQEAARMGRTIEHCFFHVGEFDLEKPDEVFLRLMQQAQADDLGLVLIENRERFPLSHQAQIPQMDVYFVQEHQQEAFGSQEIQIGVDDDIPQNGWVYFGF